MDFSSYSSRDHELHNNLITDSTYVVRFQSRNGKKPLFHSLSVSLMYYETQSLTKKLYRFFFSETF